MRITTLHSSRGVTFAGGYNRQMPACDGPLRGEGVYGPVSAFPIPDAYCLHCGKALPWTEARFSAIREIADYVDTLNEKDRQTLTDLLPDLIAPEGTPKTELAIVKMKSLLKKGGADFLEATRKVLVDVVSEVVNKALFPK
jgi:hypothetical protein